MRIKGRRKPIMLPAKAVTKKARKSSRYRSLHRRIPAYSRPYSAPTVVEKRAFLDNIRAMFRRREPETKTGTGTEEGAI
jgi:hypothetical protein